MIRYLDQAYAIHDRPADAPVAWRVGVYGCVQRNGRILMVDQIVSGGPTLSLPGGGVLIEEPILDAAVREVAEETGYRFAPDPATLTFIDEAFFRSPSGKHWHIIAFVVAGTVDDAPDPAWLADPEEITAVRWVDPATLGPSDLRHLHWRALQVLGHPIPDGVSGLP